MKKLDLNRFQITFNHFIIFYILFVQKIFQKQFCQLNNLNGGDFFSIWNHFNFAMSD